MGKSQEGFAAEYDGVYEVVKIDKLSAKQLQQKTLLSDIYQNPGSFSIREEPGFC